jgi:arylsulfatase A-like enzyme
MQSVLRGRGYQTLMDAEDIGGAHSSSFGIDEPSAVRRLLRWIDEGPSDRPFLATYLPIAGHHPYETPTPGPFPESSEVDRYHNALHYADEAVGELLDGLRQRGLARDTLVVVLGDHGEAFGEHAGNFGHTLAVYEENVRVPLLFAGPGVFSSPVRVGRVASLVDVGPTVLDLLGLPAPPGWQGQSLLDREPRMALFCTDYSLGLLGMRDGRWAFIHELESGRSSLYDLHDDPGETNDLAGAFPERAEVYREHLLRWAAAQKYRVTANKGTGIDQPGARGVLEDGADSLRGEVGRELGGLARGGGGGRMFFGPGACSLIQGSLWPRLTAAIRRPFVPARRSRKCPSGCPGRQAGESRAV